MKKKHKANTNASQEATEQSTQTAEKPVGPQNNEQIENQIEQSEEAQGSTSEEEKVREELSAMKDKYTRLMADFDNTRKRHAKERIDLIQNAGVDIIRELLPILDDFERAEAAHKASGNDEALEGTLLIHNKMRHILASKGLKPMNALHTVFDTEFHEAITNIPAPSDDLKGKVVDVVEKGYYMNDHVLRYAKVVVGK